MDISIFVDKKMIPTTENLIESLTGTYELWKDLTGYVHLKYPSAVDEWKYSGDKYGWSFRIKDKKRVIVYLLPRDKFFKTAFVFGQKATDAVMNSQISDKIKSELESARVYAEGRGIRLDILNETILNDLRTLIDIKISH
jgi:hypothetical protein